MKLVREHINEKFSEDSDPVYDMGIGLKNLIDKWIHHINNETRGYWINNKIDTYYKINKDGSIDIGKPVTKKNAMDYTDALNNRNSLINLKHAEPIVIRGEGIIELPDYIQFNKCYGDCFMNVSDIKILKGCPRIVYGNFCINDNANLKSLDFFPEIIYGNVYAMNCKTKFNKEDIEKRCSIYGKISV